MWTDFWTFLTLPTPTWTNLHLQRGPFFEFFNPPSPPPSGPHGLSMTPYAELVPIVNLVPIYFIYPCVLLKNILKSIQTCDDGMLIFKSNYLSLISLKNKTYLGIYIITNDSGMFL